MHFFFHHHFGRFGPRGFAGWGGRHGGFGGAPRTDDLQRGRKLGSADLQLLLLALLAERPSHGYELIKSLSERSNGYYSPSPGMVYPALTYLEEIGHAEVQAQGTRKLYSVTDAGRAHLDAQRSHVDALLQQLAWFGRRMDDVRRAMAGTVDADETGTPEGDAGWGRGWRWGHAPVEPEVRRAARQVLRALRRRLGAPAEEQRRVAAILERAAAEIEQDGNPPAAPPAP